jgi:hypothetical protein
MHEQRTVGDASRDENQTAFCDKNLLVANKKANLAV